MKFLLNISDISRSGAPSITLQNTRKPQSLRSSEAGAEKRLSNDVSLEIHVIVIRSLTVNYGLPELSERTGSLDCGAFATAKFRENDIPCEMEL